MNCRIIAVGLMVLSIGFTGCKDEKTEAPATAKPQVEAPSPATVEKEAAKEAESLTETAKKSVEAVKQNITQVVDNLMALDFSKFKEKIPTMDQTTLSQAADKVKELIDTNITKLAGYKDKLKALDFSEMLGPKAKEIKDQVTALSSKIDDYKKRFTIIYDRLKELGTEIQGLAQ